MAESKKYNKFEPLAGIKYVVKFKYNEPRELPQNPEHPEYKPRVSWGLTYWLSRKDYESAPGIEAYWTINADSQINTMLKEIVKKDLPISVSKHEKINERTEKPYPVFSIQFNSQTYESDTFRASAPPAQAKATTHSKGVDTMQNLNNATELMKECLKRATSLVLVASDVREDLNVTFEDIRMVAVSMFIAVSGGRTIENIAPQDKADEPPAHSDDDNDKPPSNGDDDLPF